MTSWILVGVVIELAVLPGQPPTPPGHHQVRGRQFVSQIEEHYRSVRVFSARFKQVSMVQAYTPVMLGRSRAPATLTLLGTVQIRRPWLMRWNYTSPKARVLIGDRNKIWSVMPGVAPMVWLSTKNSALPAAVGFLWWGHGFLSRNFTFFLRAFVPVDRERTVVLSLYPRQLTSLYHRVDYLVDTKTHAVLETMVYNHFGRRVHHVTFTHQSDSGALPDARFQLEPVSGAPPREVKEDGQLY
jgi:outer membrane lipoprotein-sorting protein